MGFEIVSIIAITVLSFLLFLALFEPSLRYRVSKPTAQPLDSPGFLQILAAMGDSPVFRSSHIEVLTNGEVFYPAVMEAMRQARQSINIEAYIFQKGEITRAMLDILTDRARAGVKVNLVIDAIGSFATWTSYFRRLRDAGGKVYFYHGFLWHQLPRINSRTHREIVVIDCEVGFVGGPGFADQWWKASGKKRPRWRDTMIRVEGDAVAALQSTFAENYLEASGELLSGDEYFCFTRRPSQSAALVVNSSVSSGQSTRARMLFQTLLSAASEYIEISTPYFLPDKGLRKELIRAIRRRNVRVKIICPGEHNDHLITRHTSRRLYGELLRAGARIYEYEASMFHVKSLVVDGKWAVFGSTNFDHRSFSINDELNMATSDPEVIAHFREDFARDLCDCREISYHEWRTRSLFERGWAVFGKLLERQQ
jgi:cardiolipin synthase A/B